MKDLTLCSEFDETDYFEDVDNLTVPKYFQPIIEKFAQAGAGDWIINSLTGETRSYADLNSLTQRVASALYKRGFRKGDTLLYMTYDMFCIHVVMLGVWRANGIMRASYPEDDELTLVERVKESRVGWILCEPETAEMCLLVASKVYWDVDVIVIGEPIEGCRTIDEIFNDDGSDLPECKIVGSDIALILCTSGTTGKSKGAIHTHTSLLRQIMGVKSIFPKCALHLIASKGTHITGSIFPLTCITAGKTAIVMAKITTTDLFRTVSTYRPQMIFGFPTFLQSLVNDPEASKYDFSSLEIALTGGAPVTLATEEAILTLPNVKLFIKSYGLTEVVPLTSESDPSSPIDEKYPDTPPSSVGKVCLGVALQIRDDETGEIVGPGQQGEILVKTKALFKGYLNNSKATEETFIDGWFKTGDIGYYDENGFVFIVDRIKEIFKYYNNHISPTELEDIISTHPAVTEVCVVGVIDPDGGDRIPRAFVKLQPENENSVTITEEIRKFTNDRLPNYKHLRGGVYILSEFPLGKTGKVSRKQLESFNVTQA